MSVFDALGRIPRIVEANINHALSPNRKLDEKKVREYEQQLRAQAQKAQEEEIRQATEAEMDQLRSTLNND